MLGVQEGGATSNVNTEYHRAHPSVWFGLLDTENTWNIVHERLSKLSTVTRVTLKYQSSSLMGLETDF